MTNNLKTLNKFEIFRFNQNNGIKITEFIQDKKTFALKC